ncbi:protein CONSERVED ONLY IN THE GREEN LINEAGE 160, chloroplastic isoform X1 [Ricinus communis]|uniref:protein CONSERVED ONLY IN THE GREEN LINEAGE 160, chloroplastic isoform X1 n=1 Tax=Ricinus communis TaxID=3988 RepID=UPI00201B1BCD|nr:protein CONSERVED ONLY IN THE GREEN LINEAGE 160, chloroplastic isoform X1 [Ricinus communis]
MAILNYISVTSTAAPISQDSSTPPPPQIPDPRQTKVILPKKKPLKWSTGVAPGDYGGPPTTTKLRKYWGGEDEDPLTSDEFIWNKDFMSRMKRLVQDPDIPSLEPTSVQEESSGFLSLNRVMSLDNLEVDLTKELMRTPKLVPKVSAEAATKGSDTIATKWRLAPTRREQEKWDKATKAATGGSDVLLREIRKPRGDPELLAAQSREQYFKLKNKLQILTLGVGGVGLVSAYISYSPEIAASFGAGLIGSLVYMRMLGSSIDSMADGAKGLIKGAIGQPRLLVPVVLVMIYNRWNGWCAIKSLASVPDNSLWMQNSCSRLWFNALRIDTNVSGVFHIQDCDFCSSNRGGSYCSC